ncbi:MULTISPECIES: O-antigen ligase [Halomonadaceae]|uniref:O-antigen ligase family protein n=1 Tax=Halomonadaceae TaxID=28256 RepID=UPI0015985721|nr:MULTISPECIES: O-antigen ligase family protein [Halomonas]QJQ96024.1 O-antigen ligase family protein [Halomonas sp. PA5]
MPTLFTPSVAAKLNGWVLFATLVILIATPISATALIAPLMLYATAYLIANRATLAPTRLDWAVIALLLSYLIGRLAPFVMDDFTSRYISAPLHMAASIPIYLMLRHASAALDLSRYRSQLEWGASLGAIGGGALAAYQGLVQGIERAEGFMFYLNFAYLACSLMLICLAMMRGSPRSWWLALGAIGAFMAVLFSQTRGVLLVIPVLLSLVIILNLDRIGWKRLVIGNAAIALLAVGAYATVPIVEERVAFTIEELTQIQQGQIEEAVSSGGRVQLWTAATEAFKARPSVGLTYPERETQIETLVEEEVLTEWMLSINRGHAHSQYFEVLATGGLIGIVMLAGYLLLPAAGYLWLYLHNSHNPFALAGVLFTTGFIVYSLTEVALQKEMIAAWYGYMQINLLALALASRNVRPAVSASSR